METKMKKEKIDVVREVERMFFTNEIIPGKKWIVSEWEFNRFACITETSHSGIYSYKTIWILLKLGYDIQFRLIDKEVGIIEVFITKKGD
ncbi:MAG TPA: hypothetical protein P5150_03640 [Candidatus Ratteibacteria bacterium]|nr:hypothetical protein [Candidatus Ratteibacteria bacterium]